LLNRWTKVLCQCIQREKVRFCSLYKGNWGFFFCFA
jgi:hypothetical protein